jgi:hypothetical protein
MLIIQISGPTWIYPISRLVFILTFRFTDFRIHRHTKLRISLSMDRSLSSTQAKRRQSTVIEADRYRPRAFKVHQRFGADDCEFLASWTDPYHHETSSLRKESERVTSILTMSQSHATQASAMVASTKPPQQSAQKDKRSPSSLGHGEQSSKKGKLGGSAGGAAGAGTDAMLNQEATVPMTVPC